VVAIRTETPTTRTLWLRLTEPMAYLSG
jgi:ferredoxin-NADP reductase